MTRGDLIRHLVDLAERLPSPVLEVRLRRNASELIGESASERFWSAISVRDTLSADALGGLLHRWAHQGARLAS